MYFLVVIAAAIGCCLVMVVHTVAKRHTCLQCGGWVEITKRDLPGTDWQTGYETSRRCTNCSDLASWVQESKYSMPRRLE